MMALGARRSRPRQGLGLSSRYGKLGVLRGCTLAQGKGPALSLGLCGCPHGQGRKGEVEDDGRRSAGRSDTKTGPIFKKWKIGHPYGDAPRPKAKDLPFPSASAASSGSNMTTHSFRAG